MYKISSNLALLVYFAPESNGVKIYIDAACANWKNFVKLQHSYILLAKGRTFFCIGKKYIPPFTNKPDKSFTK